MNTSMTKAAVIAAGDVAALTRTLHAEFEGFEDDVPATLKNLKAWFVWKTTEIKPDTGKFNKISFYPRKGGRAPVRRNGVQGSADDLKNLGTWNDARSTLNFDRSFAGVGVAMLPSFDVVALDVDHCIENGKVREEVSDLTKDTYCEISPSGTGIRAFWRGTARDWKNHHGWV